MADSVVGSKAGRQRFATKLMMVGVSAIAFTRPLFAQEVAPKPSQPALRRAAAVSVSVPPGSLENGLLTLGRQANLKLLYRTVITSGKQTAGVSGTMTAQEAVGRLLAGSGLTYRFTSANVVAIDQPAATASAGAATVPGAISLDTINVQGNNQSAYGPGVGYLATRSTAGTKSDTPIIETPQSISVVTRQQMDDQQPQTVNEALRYTPGIVPEVNGVTSFINQAGGILLRAFQPQSYLDGLQTTSSGGGAGIDPYLLNRVEVLSGPSSVLYGQATPGGLVNAVSKLPTETPLHEIMVQGGSYGRYEGAFDIGGPLDQNGQFLYRLTGIGFSENSPVDYTKTQELAIAPAFTWKPDADTTFTILGKYINNPTTGAHTFVPAYGSVLPNPNGRIPTSFFSGDPNYSTANQTFESIGYQFDHRFDETWAFRQNFRYEHVNNYANLLYPEGFEADLATLDRYGFLNRSSNDLIDLDNQISAKFNVGLIRNDVTIGLDYRRNTYNDLNAFNFNAPSIDVFAPVYYVSVPPLTPADYQNIHQTTDQLGLYAQDQIAVDHWHFLMGARGDWADLNSTSTVESVSTLTKQNDHAPSYRVGVVYLFDNGLAPYASYSTSFLPQTGTTFSGTPYQPLTGQQFEAGVKYQPPGWNSFITAAVYNLTEQNVLTPDADHIGFSVEAGEIRSRGIELQGHANLTTNLDLIATYTYTDALTTKDPGVTDTTIGGVTEAVQGKVPVGVPAQMASLWANYTFHDGPARGLGFGGGVRYVGSSWGDDVNSFKVPGFTLVDAALHYDLGAATPSLKGFSLQVNATNLFNKTYVASCSGSSSCWYGLGRTVYATLKYDW